ncbi:MAG: hypothetical protein Kow0069_21680 [Promethearchaeota archaeon]
MLHCAPSTRGSIPFWYIAGVAVETSVKTKSVTIRFPINITVHQMAVSSLLADKVVASQFKGDFGLPGPSGNLDGFGISRWPVQVA